MNFLKIVISKNLPGGCRVSGHQQTSQEGTQKCVDEEFCGYVSNEMECCCA